MFRLIKSEDKEVFDNSNFTKNAIFYKDMLCFYNAYSQIMEHADELPNFCYLPDNGICLEGVCLLMKMYATEFKFETLKLTLDYLKILYFSVASYAENDEVDSELIAQEFDKYREASFEFCEERKDEVKKKEEKVKLSEKVIKSGYQKYLSMQKRAKSSKIASIVMLVFSLLSISFPLLAMSYLKTGSTIFAVSVAVPVISFAITIMLALSSKNLRNHSSDLNFHILNLKKNLTAEHAELAEVQSKYYRVFCEKYEYEMYFSEILSSYSKVLDIDEIIKKAKTYKLLSYNIVYDINRLFKSQQREIDELVQDIESQVSSESYQSNLASIYKNIKNQDWLYYNSEIRYHFIKKFTDLAEREHDWKLDYFGRKINPFDVDVRALSREKIAFTTGKNNKLVTATLTDFIKTKYFKNIEELNFSNGYSVESLKKVKANYLTHFFDAKVFRNEPSVFFDTKDNNKIPKGSIEIVAGERIPTLVNLKLKLIEDSTGLGNSDAKTIKNISNKLFADENAVEENLAFNEKDIDYPKFTAEEIEETDEAIVYTVAGSKKVGYKVD